MLQEIADPIHTKIVLDETEMAIIDHPIFQRLRRVKALGFLTRVFPGATHSRFEHSIGVCHVAGRLVEGIINLHKNLDNVDCNGKWSLLSNREIDELFSAERKKKIRIAALLHDIGHGPFSHASECIMPSIELLKKSNEKVPDYVWKLLKNTTDQASHEDYSLLLTWKILDDLELEDSYIKEVLHIKFGKEIEMQLSKSQAKLLMSLVDGEFDCDRMDYLLRDSHFCGVPYGNYDIDRLLEGICIVKKSDDYSLAIRRSTVSAFEHFLFARYQMHVQIYSHRVDIAFGSAFEQLCKTLQKSYKLPPSIDDFKDVDDENFIEQIEDKDGRQNFVNLIKERELWKPLLFCYANDQSIASPLFEAAKKRFDKKLIVEATRNKPFRKEELLKLPIIAKDITGKRYISELKSISDLVTHYNTTFYYRALHVHPSLASEFKVWLSDIFTGFSEEERLAKIKAAENRGKNSKKPAKKKAN